MARFLVECANELTGKRTVAGRFDSKDEALECAKRLAARYRRFAVLEVYDPGMRLVCAVRGEC